jgi:hypothetical protein
MFALPIVLTAVRCGGIFHTAPMWWNGQDGVGDEVVAAAAVGDAVDGGEGGSGALGDLAQREAVGAPGLDVGAHGTCGHSPLWGSAPSHRPQRPVDAGGLAHGASAAGRSGSLGANQTGCCNARRGGPAPDSKVKSRSSTYRSPVLSMIVLLPAVFVIASAAVLSPFAKALGGNVAGQQATALGAGWSVASMAGAIGFFQARRRARPTVALHWPGSVRCAQRPLACFPRSSSAWR